MLQINKLQWVLRFIFAPNFSLSFKKGDIRGGYGGRLRGKNFSFSLVEKKLAENQKSDPLLVQGEGRVRSMVQRAPTLP
jgi:hypothetical protein